MRYGSVCSGIEAATSAWHSLGWTPQWFSEIEPFPSAVLAHHYPNVPNFGDMTKFKEWKLDDSTAIDVLVGGTPCQSFSVAGLRKGLDDPRGNLMLTYLAIARKYRPKWLVWENVPGVLSSSGGEDFASLLRGMGECGYGFAYRVLDAQYFGVAQRRRRVFVVGCLGDWRAAAAVLFERHSLSGHPAPSRKARKEVAGAIGARTCRSSGVQDAECGHMIPVYGGSDPECADTVTSKWSKGSGGPSGNECGLFVAQPIMEVENTASHQSQGLAWPPEIAPTLNASFGNKQGLENQHIDGGAGMFTLQPIALAENTIGRQPENGGNGDGFTVGGPMYTLNATGVHGIAQPIAFAQNTRDEVRLINGDGQIVGALAASPGMKQTSYVAIAYAFDSLSSNSMKSSNPDSGVNQVDVSKTLDTSRGLDPSCNQGGIGVVQSVSACDVADTLTVGANQTTGFIGDVVAQPIVLMDQGGSVMNVLEDGTVGTLRRETHGHEPVVMAFPWQSALDPIGKPTDISGTSIKNQTMAVGYEIMDKNIQPMAFTSKGNGDCFESAIHPTLSTGGGQAGQGYPAVRQGMAVRRLTPVECERLQGFPDNHTNIPWRKKPESPDGPRYKALGNSMAVPVMNWIGKRIQMLEDL